MSLTAVIFPGQGAQREGMGRDFCQEFAVARETYEAASDAIGVDLKALSFAEDDPRLHLTEFTQPAILTNEMAIYRVLRAELGLEPELLAGHSLGEYTALAAAEVLSFEDAVQIVHKRGELMQRAVPPGAGTMAALKLDDLLSLDAVREAIIAIDVDVANYNSRSQIVISGPVQRIEAARQHFADELPELEFVMLTVSAPFHSRWMREIESPFAAYLDQFDCDASRAGAVLSNFTGRPHPTERSPLLTNLVRQISGPVRWTDNMRAIQVALKNDNDPEHSPASPSGSTADAAPGESPIYEIGPGRPLGGFFLREGYRPPPSIVTVRCLRKLTRERVA